MISVNDIYAFLKSIAPLELQLDFDNSGLQIGRVSAPVERVLLALDVTSSVIDEAERMGAQLIISHHPLIFTPIKSVTDDTLLRLARDDIAVISMHTNLDIAPGGVNDVLIELLGARAECALDSDSCGRVGALPEAVALTDFLERCKAALNANGLRYYDAGRAVRRIAVMGGSGGDHIADAVKHGCDTYVTADIKYHQFLQAQELGINLIDGDHFCTENPVIPVLAKKLQEAFPELRVSVSSRHKQVAAFV